jgi:tetratricopeptide (TPR) repeat protein
MKRILSILLALAMVFALAGCTASDYKAAVKTMESGDYAAASAAFKALGDYEDSAALAQQCDYLLATELYNSGDYAAALAAYEALGDYEDSADLARLTKDRLLEAKLTGNWTYTMELTDMLDAFVGMDDLELPPLEMVMALDIDENLNYTMYVDAEQTGQRIQNFIDGFGVVLLDMLRAELAPYNLTLEDALPQLGVSSEEELLETLLADSGLTVDILMAEMPAAESGTLEIANEVIQVISEDITYDAGYNGETDTLTVTESVSLSGFDMEYTFEFTRK